MLRFHNKLLFSSSLLFQPTSISRCKASKAPTEDTGDNIVQMTENDPALDADGVPVDDSATTPEVPTSKIRLYSSSSNNNNSSDDKKKSSSCRPMLSDARRENLKNMYNLVGTHSAVKICRWTKSQLAGRGGCYKYSMYGIESHRCMEATPSLGCANKCTFCWRGSKHPTIKQWNFAVDEPVELVRQMVDTHASLIHEYRGLQGATKERIAEGKQPVHCALSLVGEPIVYPRINEFLAELHRRKISTFLVNNGQFPDQIASLAPICQLYLSVDAMQKQKMKELDRPIFPDFWERHQQSVRNFAPRKERTVYRLTMIEGYNMEDGDVERLAAMIRVGQPGFIELKQMTPAFNGRSTPLRITNVPKFKRLIEFALKLVDALGRDNFALPIIHEHSHCLLIADKKKFFDSENKKWMTWIDFDKFNQLVTSDPAGKTWSFEDYRRETPQWALLPKGDNVVELSPDDDHVSVLGSLPGNATTSQSLNDGSTPGGYGFDPAQKRFMSSRAKRAKERRRKENSQQQVKQEQEEVSQ